MLINNNQISLQRHSPTMAVTLSSVFLLSADDISFCDNQSEIENQVLLALTDVLALGTTLRVSNNRLQKRLTAGIISAITFGLLNQTSMNQTTHCILPFGLSSGMAVAHNREMLDLIGGGLCRYVERLSGAMTGAQDVKYGAVAVEGETQ